MSAHKYNLRLRSNSIARIKLFDTTPEHSMPIARTPPQDPQASTSEIRTGNSLTPPESSPIRNRQSNPDTAGDLGLFLTESPNSPTADSNEPHPIPISYDDSDMSDAGENTEHRSRGPNLKHIDPGVFDPNTGSNVVEFLRKYEMLAEVNRWSDQFKLDYFKVYLGGVAQTWIRTYLSRNPESDWRTVLGEFKAEFLPRGHMRNLRAKFRTRTQGKYDDPRAYYFEMIDTHDQLGINLDEKEIQETIEAGLLPELQKQITPFQPTSLRALKQAIDAIVDTEDRARRLHVQTESRGVQDELAALEVRLTKKLKEELKAEKSAGSKFIPRSNFQNFNAPRPFYQNNYRPQQRPYFNQRPQGEQPRYYPRQQDNARAGPSAVKNDSRNVGYENRNTRTHDGRPICYNCNRPGHVSRACPDTQRGASGPAQGRPNAGNGPSRR